MIKPKKVRLYINGKRKPDIYPEYTKFYVFRYNVQSFFKKFSILILVMCVLGSGLYLQKMNEPSKYCSLNFVTCE